MLERSVAALFHRAAGRMAATEWQAVWEAAYAVVLSRFSREDDIVFGVVTHGPPGAPARLSVQHAHCDDAMTAAELMCRLAQARVSSTTDPIPAEVDRLLSVLPPKDVGDIDDDIDDDTDLRSSLPCGLDVFLQITVCLDRTRPRVVAVHDPQRLSHETCTQMLASLEHVASEILLHRERPLGRIHVLAPTQERKILRDWNDTARPFPRDVGVHSAFEQQVDARPSAVAIEVDGASLTYAELERRANQLARLLHARGVGCGDTVGVCLERGANLIVTLLGVAKSGAAYVPLDPSYPAERVAMMRAIAHPALIVTEAHLRHLFDGSVVVFDARGLREGATMPDTRPDFWREATDPCYAMFTSGSTGEPKAVVLSHRAVVNTLDWVSRTFGVGLGDRLLFVTSPSFDLSVYDVFGVLGAGGTVVVASSAVLNDPDSLAKDLVDKRITLWNSTPAALESILPLLPAPTPRAQEVCAPEADARRQLRLVLLSGDWIPLPLPAAVRAAFPNAEVVALGGATEAAIWSNAFRIGEIDADWKSVPYGRPIQNVRYHILDRRMHPVPAGVAGELYIGGACLADGYLDRPQLTAERFVADPFRAGERLYRTGDLARYFADGEIELLGRADRQVKVRGFRVELTEIEGALLQQPGVRSAVCAAYPDASGQNVLIGYVVLDGASSATPAALREGLTRRLPAFMVPPHLVVCDSLPLSPNGKIDRRALALRQHIAKRVASARPSRSQIETGGAGGSAAIASCGPQQEALQALWQELFGLPTVGIHEDFYDLGGHSLLAVKMVVSIRARLGIEVPLSALMGHSTIAQLAAFLASPADEQPDAGSSASAKAGSGSPGSPVVAARRTPHLFALNETGTNPPLILVAGVGGYAFTYRNFPRLFGPEQPVFVFQSVGAEPSESLRPRSIEEIAEIYEAELEQVLPTGPVVLGGFSFGALPALELGRRLAQKGRAVPLLISLDGFAPRYPQRLPLHVRLLEHGRQLVARDSRARRAYLAKTYENVRARVLRARGRDVELAPDLPFDGALNTRAKQLWVEHMRARDRYCPASAVDSALLLIRVEQPERWLGTKMDDPLYGWERFANGPITLSTLPGSHTTLLRSYANQKAAASVIARHMAAVVQPARRAAKTWSESADGGRTGCAFGHRDVRAHRPLTHLPSRGVSGLGGRPSSRSTRGSG